MTTQVEYTANGTSAVFPFPFAIHTDADCQVLLAGVLQSGDYSIRGQGSIDGGAVVFDSPPAAGLTVTLRHRGAIPVTAADAQPGHLADKLVAGANITLSTVTEADGIQRLRITGTDMAERLMAGHNITLDDVIDAEGVQRLSIAADVAVADIAAKLKAGTNIDLSTVSEGGIDRLRITAKGAAEQLEAGANITLGTVTGTDGVQRVRIDAAQPDLTNVLRRNVSAVVEAGFWTKPVALTVTGGIATPDPLAGTVFTLTVTAATTLAFPAGMAGKAGMFLVVAKQDATGGHALTLAPGYALAGGQWSTAANAVNLLWITSDGSGTALDVVVAQRGA